MSQHRIIIESNFSIERRSVKGGTRELSPQPDFILLHLLRSNIAGLPTGASLLANPNQSIPLDQNRRRCELLMVRLTPHLLIETAARLRRCRTGSHLLFREPLTPVMKDARLRSNLESIASEMENGETGWHEVIHSMINQLSVYLLREHINVQRSDEIELSRAGVVDRRLRRAIEYMHDNCGRDLNLAEISQAAFLSEFHFARLFKKITGRSPHSYLASMRIERARRLLAETDLPITEVAAQVGYSGQSHFTKVFREATGTTPRAFRLAAQEHPRFEERSRVQKKWRK
jgi:AraC family transcriptional regulator